MLRFLNKSRHSLTRFRKEEGGAITLLNLYLMIGMALMGGLAVDVAHLVATRTKLQMTADLAAHAALYTRDSASASEARDAALQVIEASMPADIYGTVITAEDIMFGDYTYGKDEFVVDEDSRTAVLVNAGRYAERQNSVGSFLLQFAGFDDWDLASQAVFVTFRPACLREGFVGQGVVDLQSNNGFSNGFCVHSNTHVSLNSNNTFAAGTVVSMPDLDDLDLPKSGFETNEGLETALREGRMHLRVLNQLDEIYQNILVFGSEHNPDYIVDSTVYQPNGSRFSATDFTPGRMYYFNCSNRITLDGHNGPFTQIVIVSECPIKFGSGVVLQDVRMLTTSTRNDSFKAVSGMQIGRDDNCADGGGAQLITFGGMRFPADLQLYGAQLIAEGNIQFAANANGIQGASLIAGEWIEGTSNMEMAFCGTGMENNFEAEYFRLAL